jgi:hypothetical protein
MRNAIASGILAAALAAPLAAQAPRLRVSAEGVAQFVRESSPTAAEEQAGTWAGAQVRVEKGRLSGTVRSLFGPLGGNPLRIDRDARVTSLAVRYAVLPWLGVGLDAEALRLAADIATSVWRTYGLGAGVSTGLGLEGFTVHADVGVSLASSVAQALPISRATRAEAGVRYAVPRVPVTLRFDYRVTTVDFTDAADLRFGGPVVGVMVLLKN